MKQTLKILMVMTLLLSSLGCVFLKDNVPASETDLQAGRFRGEIVKGMSKEQVLELWGQPDKVIIQKRKTHDEIWVYYPHWKVRINLFFQNGILQKGIK